MPDRIIRDELMRSHRYRTLSSDTARLLFVHLLLSVDALGNMEADSTAVEDALRRHIDAATAAKLLSELADVDLIRLYENGGKRYLHVPRFRQRLRYVRGKHPRPPEHVECNEIRELLEKVGPKTDRSQTGVGLQSLEVKRSEVKRSEVKRSKPSESYPQPEASTTEKPFDRKQVNPQSENRTAAFISIFDAAKRLGLEPAKTETAPEFQKRVSDALLAQGTGTHGD